MAGNRTLASVGLLDIRFRDMAEIIIAAILLFTNKAYIKPEEIIMPKVYAEKIK